MPELETGFHLLYELKLEEARAQLESWGKSHPEDPLGSGAVAAAYLFEECYRQGVLTSEFFLDDKRFMGKVPLKPDPEMRAAFLAADKRAQELAKLRLQEDPDDPNALFAMTLSLGMEADYAALIDKHQKESLKMIRDADKYAKKLLAAAPEGTDAYLTLGTANYIIGVSLESRSFFLASPESTATGTWASGSSKWPPRPVTICARLRRLCWRWPPCVRKSRKWPACN